MAEALVRFELHEDVLADMRHRVDRLADESSDWPRQLLVMRRAAGWTQTETAERVGMTPSRFANVERGNVDYWDLTLAELDGMLRALSEMSESIQPESSVETEAPVLAFPSGDVVGFDDEVVGSFDDDGLQVVPDFGADEEPVLIDTPNPDLVNPSVASVEKASIELRNSGPNARPLMTYDGFLVGTGRSGNVQVVGDFGGVDPANMTEDEARTLVAERGTNFELWLTTQ